MLEAAETGARLDKTAYQEEAPKLRVGLLNAQYDLRKADFRVLVVIAGDDRPGSEDLLHLVHEWMDGRYVKTEAFAPRAVDEGKPRLASHWRALPRRGQLGLFLGGATQSAIARRATGEIDGAGFERELASVLRFQEQLVEDGDVVAKLWVHLPESEHRKRLKRSRKKGEMAWRLDETDWRICDEYDRLRPVAEEGLRLTSSAAVPWTLVEGTDPRHRDIVFAQTLLEAIEGRLAAPPRPEPAPLARPPRSPAAGSVLDAVDLTRAVPHDDYKPRLAKLQGRLAKLADRAAEARLSSVLVFEGWDAAGKGGVIRRLTRCLDPRDTRVIPVAAPSEEERAYPYLWRFWQRLPEPGRSVIFDRSWYGRVLVERVEGFATESEWQRAYSEIDDFEAQLARAGIVLCKFWLHIDPDEQLRRFQAREQLPYKKYKITGEDYRNRERWDAYVEAVAEMVERTSTAAAPWHLIAANDKRSARLEVLETVCDAFKRGLKAAGKR